MSHPSRSGSSTSPPPKYQISYSVTESNTEL